jgi:hypothetical protein
VASSHLNTKGGVMLMDAFSKIYGPLLPEEHQVPNTAWKVNKAAGEVPQLVTYYDVCPGQDCHVFVGDELSSCPECGSPRKIVRQPRELLCTDVLGRLKQMFAIPELAQAFKYPTTRARGDGDIWDGELMRDIPEDRPLTTIYLLLSSDG